MRDIINILLLQRIAIEPQLLISAQYLQKIWPLKITDTDKRITTFRGL
jgi:hypothetical protein